MDLGKNYSECQHLKIRQRKRSQQRLRKFVQENRRKSTEPHIRNWSLLTCMKLTTVPLPGMQYAGTHSLLLMAHCSHSEMWSLACLKFLFLTYFFLYHQFLVSCLSAYLHLCIDLSDLMLDVLLLVLTLSFMLCRNFQYAPGPHLIFLPGLPWLKQKEIT